MTDGIDFRLCAVNSVNVRFQRYRLRIPKAFFWFAYVYHIACAPASRVESIVCQRHENKRVETTRVTTILITVQQLSYTATTTQLIMMMIVVGVWKVAIVLIGARVAVKSCTLYATFLERAATQ